jgi:HAMP domain-containing protein
MKSLFARMFLWFCAASAILICAIVFGYALTNPDQIPFGWPRVGRGAILSAGRIAVDSYERGGPAELARYLELLAQDTGLQGALYDSSEHELSGRFAANPPEGFSSYPKGRVLVSTRNRRAGVKLNGHDNALYTFTASVPGRDRGGFWFRAFVVSFVLTGGLLCYLLARHITSPVVHLRTVTSRFSGGDLRVRVTLPSVLERKDEIGGLAQDFNQMAARIETLLKAQ